MDESVKNFLLLIAAVAGVITSGQKALKYARLLGLI
jgi:hypothetical protein